MKILASLYFLFLAGFALTAQQNWSWLKTSQISQAVAVPVIKADALGNSYIMGAYFNSVTIGASTFSSQGGNDGFIIKMDAEGNILWSVAITGPTIDYFSDFEVDQQGNLYCTGSAESQTTTIGSQSITNNSNSLSFFLCKILPTGQVDWISRFDKGGVVKPQLEILGTNVFVAGSYGGTLAAGGSTFVAAGLDLFLAKFDLNGTVAWVKCHGGSGNENLYDLTVPVNGNPLISAYFSSTQINFGSFTVTGTGSLGNQASLLMRYDSGGNVLWAKSNTTNQGPGRLASYGNGDFICSGSYNGSVCVIDTYSLSGSGAYLSKFDKDGNILWLSGPSGPGVSRVVDVEIDSYGNAIAFGVYTGNTISAGTFTLANDSTADQLFIAAYNSSGSPISLQSYGGKYTDNAECMTIAPNGDLYIAGNTIGLSLQIGTLSSTQPKKGNFAFIAKANGLATDLKTENTLSSLLMVFPNPCLETLHIKIDEEVSSIRIVDVNGRANPLAFESERENYSVDVSSLASGLYILEITTETKRHYAKFLKDAR